MSVPTNSVPPPPHPCRHQLRGWYNYLFRSSFQIPLVFGVGRCNEVLLYNTENYIQSLGIEHDGRQRKRMGVYIYMTGLLCCMAEIDTTL